MADKDHNGVINNEELVGIITKYKMYIRAQPDIMKFIEEYDTNHDHILDPSEMQTLLQASRPTPPTAALPHARRRRRSRGTTRQSPKATWRL